MVANSIAAGNDARARDSVLAAERIRQNSFNQETAALNTQSQDRYVGFEPQMAQEAATMGDYLASSVSDPNAAAGSGLPSSTSDVVNQERAAQTGEAQQFVDQQSGALADLRSFGDLLGETSLLQSRDAGQISSIGGFKRGSSGVVPLELNEAGKAGDNARFLADLLGGAGSVATGYGISGQGSTALTRLFGNATTDPIGMMPKFGALQSFRVT